MLATLAKNIIVGYETLRSKRQNYWNIHHFRPLRKRAQNNVILRRDIWLGVHR